MPHQPGQLALPFEEPNEGRQSIPQWLNSVTTSLLKQRSGLLDVANDIIPWSSPVPFFGDVTTSLISTIAVNPSNREFCDKNGNPLSEAERRLETLGSLSLQNWNMAKPRHCRRINLTAMRYFHINPYTTWFRHFEQLLSGADASYYGSRRRVASHLDLIPYATCRKWTSLDPEQRTSLLAQCGNPLAALLRNSPIRVIVLNGAAVARQLAKLSEASFVRRSMKGWDLPRQSGKPVRGLAIQGEISQVGGESLGRSIQVVGFNHNLQSSFGVTTAVKSRIRRWIGMQVNEALNET